MSLFYKHFRRLFDGNDRSQRVGLCVSPQALTLLLIETDVRHTDVRSPRIIDALHILREPDSPLEACLQTVKEFVAHKKLQKQPCICVLSESDYQMLLIDPPDVPEEEIVDAIRWKIRDLIQEDIEKTTITYFPQVDNKKLYTVVSEKDRIQTLVDFVSRAGLSLKAIDIEELAYRNYFDQHPMMERGLAVITAIENAGKLFIFKQGNLVFSRKFTMNSQANAFSQIEDDFILEVQRSLDYYERQMGQSSPAEILLCGEIKSSDISELMKSSFQQQISSVDVTAANDAEIDLPNHIAVAVTGAAIRQ